MSKIISNNRVLASTHAFVGLSAMAGGLYLVATPEVMPLDWLDGTFFQNYFLPGVILFGIVGSSAIIAAFSLLLRLSGRYMASLIASVLLIFWLIAEIVIIAEIHFLQVVYFVLAFASLYLLFRSDHRAQSN